MGHWKSHYITVLISIVLLCLAVAAGQLQGQKVMVIACVCLFITLVLNAGNLRRSVHFSRDNVRAGINLRLVEQLNDAIVGIFGTLTYSFRQVQDIEPSATEKFSLLSGQMERIMQLLSESRFNAGKAGLLAMNAAIEAARTGVKGKAFAAAADEVKLLSFTIMKFNDEVQVLIQSVQEVIDKLAHTVSAKITGIPGAPAPTAWRTETAPQLIREFDVYLQDTLNGIIAVNRELSERIEGIVFHLHPDYFFKMLSESNDKEMEELCGHFHFMNEEITKLTVMINNSDLINKSNDFLDRLINTGLSAEKILLPENTGITAGI